MTNVEEIKIVLSLLFDGYDEDDVAEAIIDKFEDDSEEGLLHYIPNDIIIEEAMELMTDNDINEAFEILNHSDWTNINTTSINKQRMLAYLKENMEDISLESLEYIIKNNIR